MIIVERNRFEVGKSSEEIAKRICELAYGNNTDLERYNEIEKAIYYLKCVAENEYNSDYFRTCYKTLEKI